MRKAREEKMSENCEKYRREHGRYKMNTKRILSICQNGTIKQVINESRERKRGAYTKLRNRTKLEKFK